MKQKQELLLPHYAFRKLLSSLLKYLLLQYKNGYEFLYDGIAQ